MIMARSFFSRSFSAFAQIHEHGDEGSLSIGGQQRYHLILNGLNTAADLPQTASTSSVIFSPGSAPMEAISASTILRIF